MCCWLLLVLFVVCIVAVVVVEVLVSCFMLVPSLVWLFRYMVIGVVGCRHFETPTCVQLSLRYRNLSTGPMAIARALFAAQLDDGLLRYASVFEHPGRQGARALQTEGCVEVVAWIVKQDNGSCVAMRRVGRDVGAALRALWQQPTPVVYRQCCISSTRRRHGCDWP